MAKEDRSEVVGEANPTTLIRWIRRRWTAEDGALLLHRIDPAAYDGATQAHLSDTRLREADMDDAGNFRRARALGLLPGTMRRAGPADDERNRSAFSGYDAALAKALSIGRVYNRAIADGQPGGRLPGRQGYGPRGTGNSSQPRTHLAVEFLQWAEVHGGVTLPPEFTEFLQIFSADRARGNVSAAPVSQPSPAPSLPTNTTRSPPSEAEANRRAGVGQRHSDSRAETLAWAIAVALTRPEECKSAGRFTTAAILRAMARLEVDWPTQNAVQPDSVREYLTQAVRHANQLIGK